MRRVSNWIGDHFVLVLIGLIAVGFIYLDWQDAQALRGGCERQNDRTGISFEKYLADEWESRQFSEITADPHQAAVTLKAAEQYEGFARGLIESVKDDGVQLEQGSPATDCDQVFPDPFPLTLF